MNNLQYTLFLYYFFWIINSWIYVLVFQSLNTSCFFNIFVLNIYNFFFSFYVFYYHTFYFQIFKKSNFYHISLYYYLYLIKWKFFFQYKYNFFDIILSINIIFLHYLLFLYQMPNFTIFIFLIKCITYFNKD